MYIYLLLFTFCFKNMLKIRSQCVIERARECLCAAISKENFSGEFSALASEFFVLRRKQGT